MVCLFVKIIYIDSWINSFVLRKALIQLSIDFHEIIAITMATHSSRELHISQISVCVSPCIIIYKYMYNLYIVYK